MFLIGLGALLVLGGILYTARAAIWRGSHPLAARIPPGRFATVWSRHGGVRCLGLGTNWPGILLMAISAILLVSGADF